METKIVHTISTKSLLKVLAFFVTLFFLYYIRSILLLLFVAFIFSSLIDPFASQLQKRKIPRSLAVIIIYVIIIGLVSLIFTLLAPVITQDLPIFIENIQYLFADIEQHQKFIQINEIFKQFGLDISTEVVNNAQTTNGAISKIFSKVSSIFEYVFSFGIVLVVTFYLVVQDDSLKKFFKSVVPADYVPYATQIFKKIKDKLGAWMRGQMILSLIIGLLVFTGLSILNVRHAAILSILAALMEFIPYIGPSLAAAPAMLIAFTQGGFLKMMFVTAMYLVLQQLENHLLVPKIMQKAVGLNPIVSIFAILIGAKLAGPVGVLLAIPTVTVVSIFMQDVFTPKM